MPKGGFRPLRFALTGTRLKFAGERIVRRKDGTDVIVWAFEITCATCQRWFEFTQARPTIEPDRPQELDLGRLMRRCPECRAHGRERCPYGEIER